MKNRLIEQTIFTILGYLCLGYSFSEHDIEARVMYQVLALALFSYSFMVKIK